MGVLINECEIAKYDRGESGFGGSVVIAQFRGAKDDDMIRNALAVSLYILSIWLVLVFFLGLLLRGVFGVGLATVMAQTISGLLCLLYFYVNHRELIPNRENFHLQLGLIGGIFKVALPAAMQMMFEGLGMMAVQREINGFGANVTIAYTAASKIDMIAMQPMMATGTAMSTYAGQNYGAKNMKRIKPGIWYAVAISAGVCLVVTLVIRFAGQSLAGLFISDADLSVILPIAGEYLNVVSIFYFIGSLMYIFTGVLRGMGYSFTSMVTSVLQMAAKLGAVIVLPAAFGYHGIWYAWPIAWACALIFSMIYFYCIKEIRKVG